MYDKICFYRLYIIFDLHSRLCDTAPHPPNCHLYIVPLPSSRKVLRVLLCSDRALHHAPEGSLSHTTDKKPTCAAKLNPGACGVQPAQWQPHATKGSAQTALPHHQVRRNGEERREEWREGGRMGKGVEEESGGREEEERNKEGEGDRREEEEEEGLEEEGCKLFLLSQG